MTNLNESPNRLQLCNEISVTGCFGMPYAALPVHHVAGLGHHDMLALKFYGGLSLTLTPLAGLWIVDHVAETVARIER